MLYFVHCILHILTVYQLIHLKVKICILYNGNTVNVLDFCGSNSVSQVKSLKHHSDPSVWPSQTEMTNTTWHEDENQGLSPFNYVAH